LDDHSQESLNYQVLKQQLVILERQFSETVFMAGLDKHMPEISKMQRVYGKQIFEKKRKEQADRFHEVIIEKKVKKEYDRIDRLVDEKNRLLEAVTKEQMIKRMKNKAKLQRL
jgi:hypothetical protein